ncbi:MAG: ABC transporter ATP-binding protein/permease [Rhodobacteraceae bacterium]|nr:ABC transporter ATP-binding protein/permease [Paracoccaceae bacterium]
MTRTLLKQPLDESFAHQLGTIVGSLRSETGGRRLVLLVAAIIAVIIGTAIAQVELNAWNQPFYDAIQRKDLPEFLHQLGVFFAIAAVLLVLNVSQTGLTHLIKLKLRELATQDLVRHWMRDRRAARIGRAGEIGENPDQRMHADAQHLADLSTGLWVGLVQSSILLISFVGVLWVLSENVTLSFGGTHLQIPGYMVWAALIYAAGGSWVSWRVGRPLVRLESTHYALEAGLRFAMVRGAEQADAIALNGAEKDVRHQIEGELSRVLTLLRRMVLARIRLASVTAGYGWVGLVVPIIVAAPGYFGGKLSFGELMMVVGAFRQVQSALAWFVDNTETIADWRATLLRVMTFRKGLRELDRYQSRIDRITRVRDPDRGIAVDKLVVTSMHGRIELAEPHLEVSPGERILLLGRPRTGKSTVFLAMAGLWEWGSGRISLPAEARTMFLSQRPFAPPGTLRIALTYGGDRMPADDELRAALERVRLGHLGPRLDDVARWDRELSVGEQERLGYARLLVRRPDWLICDDGLDPLDDADRTLIRAILEDDLARTAVINIAGAGDPRNFYSRVVRLVCHPEAETDSNPVPDGNSGSPASKGAAVAGIGPAQEPGGPTGPDAGTPGATG